MQRLIFIFLVAVILNGCARRATGPIVSSATLEKRLADIHALIEKGNCKTAAQCSYIAYGKKACGGPQGYLVFSNNIDVEKLKKLVNEYTIAEDVYNRENNVISDCSLPNPPEKMECKDGRCVEVQ